MSVITKCKQIHRLRNLRLPKWKVGRGWGEKLAGTDQYLRVKSGAVFLLFSCSVLCNSLQHHGLQPRQMMPMGFSRQEYQSGLPFLSSGNLPKPGIKPRSPESVLNCRWILLPPTEQVSHKTGAEGLQIVTNLTGL